MKNSARLPARSLQVSNLAVTRGEREIIDSLSFEAVSGRALLLRGPNGAGKSTLLMCLAGFLHPLSGKIVWTGRNEEERPGTDIHFLGHRNAVKQGLTVAENLQFWADVNAGDRDMIPQALETARLDHASDLDAGFLSAGQTKRLAICRLLIAERPIWLLDEPTAALDAQGDKWLASLIDDHIGRGGMVVAATHLDLLVKERSSLRTLELGAAQ